MFHLLSPLPLFLPPLRDGLSSLPYTPPNVSRSQAPSHSDGAILLGPLTGTLNPLLKYLTSELLASRIFGETIFPKTKIFGIFSCECILETIWEKIGFFGITQNPYY